MVNIVVKVEKEKNGNLQSDIKTSCTGKRKDKKGGVPSGSLVLCTVNPSTFPGAFQHCSVKNLLSPCPSSWSSGGGAAVLSGVCTWGRCSATCRCQAQWELLTLGGLCPLRPRPSQAQGDTRRNNPTGVSQLSSPCVSSCSNSRRSQSTGAWMLQGIGGR